jgi:intracellular sulfur oxidation DsrE/DsrF family protein
MKSISRRSFVGSAAAGFAALASPTVSAEAELLYKPSDWHMASFDQLLKQHYDAKQLYDVTAIEDGNAFDHMVNSLNGLHFGFGFPSGKIKLIAALRAQATYMNFGDDLWDKYHIGAITKTNDPKTGKPATRNIFYASSFGNPPKYTSQNPNDSASAEQDASIQALQSRGVQFLACHMAIEYQSRTIAKKLNLKPEDVAQEVHSHLIPNVIIVPSMVSAIAVLENKGHYGYIRM